LQVSWGGVDPLFLHNVQIYKNYFCQVGEISQASFDYFHLILFLGVDARLRGAKKRLTEGFRINGLMDGFSSVWGQAK
jgi:hypothetical protein